MALVGNKVNPDWHQTVVEALRSPGNEKRGYEIAPGLTDAEIVSIQERFEIVFPDDLRAFLQFALPVGTGYDMYPELKRPRVGFVDWRNADYAELRNRLARPVEDIMHEVVHDNFWHRRFGPRPDSHLEAFRAARASFAAAPTLVPIFGHRYVSSKPSIGSPVLSMYGTDIISYGDDLASYFAHEFKINGIPEPAERRSIPFWSDFENLTKLYF